MKAQSFEIKVSDLLNHLGSDEILFEEKFTHQLPTLDKKGISGKLLLQAVDHHSVLVTLLDVECVLEESCDSCQSVYKNQISLPRYSAKFALLDEKKEEEENEEEEVVFPIDPKGETVNVEDMLSQGIILQEPFVKRCPSCEKKLEESDDDMDSWEDEGSLGGGNIVFR